MNLRASIGRVEALGLRTRSGPDQPVSCSLAGGRPGPGQWEGRPTSGHLQGQALPIPVLQRAGRASAWLHGEVRSHGATGLGGQAQAGRASGGKGLEWRLGPESGPTGVVGEQR